MKYQQRGNCSDIKEWVDKHPTPSADKKYRFDLKDVPDRIKTTISKGEKITVIGDYDVDGVCASAIMATAIRELGGNVTIRLPLRFSEGYGMKPSMVDEIASGLVLTVDNGITAHEAVKAAKAKGLEVVVTDHHGVSKEMVPTIKDGLVCQEERVVLPEADCIINPHVEETLGIEGSYDFYDYCGAGVALKIAEAVLGEKHPVMDKLYAYAALATVADVMPLVEDNRNIVIRGIGAMARGEVSPGLYQLLAQNKIDLSSVPETVPPHCYITSDTLGYKIAPCINAASRLLDDGAYKALTCLLADKNSTGLAAALDLIKLNEQRKLITEQEQKQVADIVGKMKPEDRRSLVVYLKDCAPGIIGLHAGRLCEQYGVPVVVIGGEGDKCKGSCRSPENANIKSLLDSCQDLLIGYGGHPGAAGLTISESKIDELRDRIEAECIKRDIVPQLSDAIEYDVVVPSSEIGEAIRAIENLAPFGMGNPEPVVCVPDCAIEEARILGGKHLKIDGTISAIGFNMCDGSFDTSQLESGSCSLVGTLGYNCFRGDAKPQLQIIGLPKEDELDIFRDEGDIAEDDIDFGD